MAPSIELRDFDAVLFDLDGVLTTTRAVHAAAWKHSFDEFLAAWDAQRAPGPPVSTRAPTTPITSTDGTRALCLPGAALELRITTARSAKVKMIMPNGPCCVPH
jgi:hypothetical protein